jgi:hypothetical protein
MTWKEWVGVLACIQCSAESIAKASAPDGNQLWWLAAINWVLWGAMFLQPLFEDRK